MEVRFPQVGITGTQRGLTFAQYETATELLGELDSPPDLHHGGCIGADEQIARLTKRLWPHARLFCYRGHTRDKWAELDSSTTFVGEPTDNLRRNRVIVLAVERVWAFPGEKDEVLRSGTWATIRYAKKVKRPLWVVFPDGSYSVYNEV